LALIGRYPKEDETLSKKFSLSLGSLIAASLIFTPAISISAFAQGTTPPAATEPDQTAQPAPAPHKAAKKKAHHAKKAAKHAKAKAKAPADGENQAPSTGQD
jgi:hypothetical protein